MGTKRTSDARVYWFACRCDQCGRDFESTRDDFVCPRCQAIHDDAIKQTNTMPAPKLEDRPWSKSAMRERLGVTGDVDE